MLLYLDANAHLPQSKPSLKAYADFNSSKAGHGHPSALSEPGRLACNAVEEARSKIAKLIGAKSDQIFFTSGCTQACYWGLQILNHLPAESSYISPVEHFSVKDSFQNIFKTYQTLQIDKNGVLSNLDYKNARVACIHLQNEIGIIQPIDNIKCNYLFSDMSQSFGKINVDVSNVDIAVAGCHKFGGPGGIGFMYLKNTNHWRDFDYGSRYAMDRAGTPDVAGIVASAAALEDALQTLPERSQTALSFRNVLEDGLKNMGLKIISEEANRSPYTTFVYIPNIAATVLLRLSEKGIFVGFGSACGSISAGPSPTLKALKLPGNGNDYLRISQWGNYGAKEAKYFLDVLIKEM